MATLKTAADVKQHLRDALNGTDRWVFLTDSARGHACMCHLASALVVATSGKALDRMGFGNFELLEPRTQTRIPVSFLTIEKPLVKAAHVRLLLAMHDLKDEPSEGQDIIAISDTEIGADCLRVLVMILKEGGLHAFEAGAN